MKDRDFPSRLLEALAPLAEGMGGDGRYLNAAKIGTRAAAQGRAYTAGIMRGEAREAQRPQKRYRG